MPASCHVLLYGPPAAGKLTVARALAERTGARLLDNHVSMDPALRLFEFGTPELFRLVERLRVELLEAASAAGLDVVSTLVYAHPGDRGHVDALTAATERHGGRVVRVQLRPERAVLRHRLGAASRRGTRKIVDAGLLDRLLSEHDLITPIEPTDLALDNTVLAPAAAAALIADHAGVPTRR